MNLGAYRILKYLNILLDICCLIIAILIGFFYGVPDKEQYYAEHKVLLFIITLLAIWLLCANYFSAYNNYDEKSSESFFHQLFKAFVAFIAGTSIIASLLLIRDDSFDRVSLGVIFYLFLFTIFFIGLIGVRLFFLGIRKKLRNAGKIQRRKILVVGGNCFSKEMSRQLLQESYQPFQVVGVFYNRESNAKDGLNGLYKGNFQEAFQYLEHQKVDEIFCLTKGLDTSSVHKLMSAADNHVVRFRMLLDVYDYLPSRGQIEMINQIPVFRARTEPLLIVENAFLKRFFDIVFSGLVIICILSWLLPILAILIKLESKGPIFFKQLRSGRDNKSFPCLKLRSMYVNKNAHLKQAVKNDRRITKMGNILRKTSLDELPQFFNVFMGHMSVVGPRPHMLAHTEEYAALVNRYMARHFLRPGITGWAQVNGSRGETKTVEEMEKRVKLDVWYMENWSFFLDLKIIFLTFWQVIKGDEKAY